MINPEYSIMLSMFPRYRRLRPRPGPEFGWLVPLGPVPSCLDGLGFGSPGFPTRGVPPQSPLLGVAFFISSSIFNLKCLE